MASTTHPLAAAARYAPPPERFGVGSLGIAFLVHGFLIAALTWGTTWRSDTPLTTASAELWAEVPVQAAPPLAELPPLPPEPAPLPLPEPPIVKAPEIVVQKVKTPPTKKELRTEAAKRKAHEAEEQAERLREQVRQEQIKRMAGLAGATGAATSAGTAQQSAAPSASYKGFLISLIRPNIVYQNAELERSNFTTDIEFQLASDGTILRPRIAKSSGNKEWDAIALRAINRTQIIPRDSKGFRPDGTITIGISPKDK